MLKNKPGCTAGIGFADIVDIEHLRELLTNFNRLTGISAAIIRPDGDVDISISWQDVCTKFHRVCDKTRARCIESDQYINAKVQDSDYIEYRCKNGLWDIASPIVVDGYHYATLFIGQFFYTDDFIDIAYFEEQAETFGFDKQEYIKAIKKVPVFERSYVKDILDYLLQLVSFISELGFSNKKLMNEIKEREEIEQALEISEKRYRFLVESMNDGFLLLDSNGRVDYCNEKFSRMIGFPKSEIVFRHFSLFCGANDCFSCKEEGMCEALKNTVEKSLISKDGEEIPVLLSPSDELSLSSGFEGISVVVTDLSARLYKEHMRLQTARRQRDSIFKEVNHRIKNNLHGIMAILRSADRDKDDPFEVINRSASQVESIAKVFDLRCRDNMKVSVTKLLGSLCSSVSGYAGEVVVQEDHKDCICVYLADEEAVPIALIFNELITNGMKHLTGAYENNVSLKVLNLFMEGVYMVEFRNMGVLSENFNFLSGEGCGDGLDLIKSLLPKDNCKFNIAHINNEVVVQLSMKKPVISLEKK